MSSSEIAVQVQNLSKRYMIGGQSLKKRTLTESIVQRIKHPLAKPELDEFWALKDIDFEVRRGEVVGIIGRNGAGKSTLLKVLSRITDPTTGQIDLYGRVGSLLEVGTGFHGELTGRENIFLNGAILGMSRREIAKHLDEIVDFAEVEKFLDTPVKRYSSGMYVRLAFAVAAHLNPSILIVDEVLAVGDVAFQKKCLGKMENVAQSGRTIFFVSHHIPSVLLLCNRGIFLENGSIVIDGPVQTAVEAYVKRGVTANARSEWSSVDAPGTAVVRLLSVAVLDSSGVDASADFYISDAVQIEASFECLVTARLNTSLHVFNATGTCVFISTNVTEPDWGKRVYEPGTYTTRCVIPGHLLNEGKYNISFFVSRDVSGYEAHADEAVGFVMIDDGSDRGDYTGTWTGLLRPALQWQTCSGTLEEQ